jgi:uncharacterized Zn ribbon protein
MSVLSEYKDNLIYEIQREFWNERGKGARYRLTLIGTDFIGKQLKDPTNFNEIKDLLVKEGFCKSLEFSEDEFKVNLKIKGCEFLKVRDTFMNKTDVNGDPQQPLSCPLANVLMRAVEITTGLGPELLPIERNGDECIVGLGKMGTSEVVTK